MCTLTRYLRRHACNLYLHNLVTKVQAAQSGPTCQRFRSRAGTMHTAVNTPLRLSHLGRFISASLVTLLTGSVLYAQTTPPSPAPCDVPVQRPQDIEAQQLQSAVSAQLQQLPQCQKSVPWLAWMGQALNHLGRYPEAAEHLERAIMLEPAQAVLQLDYAVALAGSGDRLAAIQLLQILQVDPLLPKGLHASIQQQVDIWSASRLSPLALRHSRIYLSTRLGYDSNLLGTPNLSSLTLTLPGQSLQLPLDASYLRRPGYYSRIDAGWTATQGAWQLAASVGGRHSPQESGAELQQAQASAEHTSARHYASATLGYLHNRSHSRYRTVGLSAGLQHSSADQSCQSRSGLEWQQRNLRSNPVLSGHYGGLLWQTTCQGTSAASYANTGLGLQAWHLSARWGFDAPSQAHRPGGRQQQASLRGVLMGSGLAHQHQWLLDAEIYRQQDASGYSPLLQANATRRLTRTALRFEYKLPLPQQPAWQWALGIEWQRQHANLPLFLQRSQGAYMALRTQW